MLCYRIILFTLLSIVLLMAPFAYAKQTYSVAVEWNDPVSKIMFDSLSNVQEIDFEFIEFNSYSEMLKAVSSGRVDLLANITYTEQRAKTLDFTAPTNIEYVYLFTRNNLSLSQARVLAVPAATIYHYVIAEEFPQIQFVQFEHASEALRLLNAGLVDGVVERINQLEYMTLSGTSAAILNDSLPLHPVSVAAVKGKYQDLLNIIEEHAHSVAFQKLLRRTIKRYQRQIRKLALRKEAVEKGINTDVSLRVKLENVKLFVNYQPDGSVDGITAEILNQVCEILQLQCQLVSEATEAWSSMYESLYNHSIDVLSPLAITETRREIFHLSDSYYSPEAILVKRKYYKDDVYRSISEMVVERIGVVKGNFFEVLLTNMLPGKELYTYSSQAELLDGLLNREVDYILITRAAFHSKLRQASSMIQIAEEGKVGVVYSYDLGFGFPNTEQGKVLAELFSKALNLVDLNRIVKKYDYPPDWYNTINDQKKRSRNGIFWFVAIFSSLVLIMGFFYRRSITDELTQLRNRLALYRRYGKSFPLHKILIYLDVNKFKAINDTFGHRVGDQVLKRLADNITHHWGAEAYRIGGDEFVLVCRGDRGKVEQRLKKISTFSFWDKDSNQEVVVTTSVGMAGNLDKSLPLDEVLQIADQSMYQSKARFRHAKRSSK